MGIFQFTPPPVRQISTVATIGNPNLLSLRGPGFLGSFMSSPVIGYIADRSNLSVALGVFAALILLCIFFKMDSGSATNMPR